MPASPGQKRRKSRRQVRFLLSKGSPLTIPQRERLKRELKSGAVTTTKR